MRTTPVVKKIKRNTARYPCLSPFCLPTAKIGKNARNWPTSAAWPTFSNVRNGVTLHSAKFSANFPHLVLALCIIGPSILALLFNTAGSSR